MTQIALYFGDRETAIPRDVVGIVPAEDYLQFFSGPTPVPHRIVFLDQVHSADIVIADDINVDNMSLQADALVTTMSHLALGVKTADCAPILLYDTERGVIAAVHSGWQSTLKNIVTATILCMHSKGAVIADIRAHIGPCLQQGQFDVDDDFRRNFMQTIPASVDMFIPHGSEPDKYKFDNAALIAWQLKQAGVTHVIQDPTCVFMHDEKYYSYRQRAKDPAHEDMRNVTLIWQY